MSGKRFLLDTNAIIAMLKGNDNINSLLSDAEWIGISIISRLEFLSFSAVSEQDIELFESFMNRISVVDLADSDENLMQTIINLRQISNFKLPDAIIAGSALSNDAQLVTQDKQLLNNSSVDCICF